MPITTRAVGAACASLAAPGMRNAKTWRFFQINQANSATSRPSADQTKSVPSHSRFPR